MENNEIPFNGLYYLLKQAIIKKEALLNSEDENIKEKNNKGNK